MGSLVTSLFSRHTLRTGRHLSTLAQTSQIVVGVDGQGYNIFGHLLLPGRENGSEIQYATKQTFSLPFYFCPSTHTIHSENPYSNFKTQ